MTTGTRYDWPTPQGAAGVVVTASAVGVLCAAMVASVGYFRPTLLVPVAAVVLAVAGPCWLLARYRARRVGVPAYDDDGQWAEEYHPRSPAA